MSGRDRAHSGAPRPQSAGEELANSLSHGAALIGALAGGVFLLDAGRPRDATAAAGAAIFIATMVLLYLSSTLYHCLPPGRVKRVLLRIDHAAIYLFIAGSYTPFALGTAARPWGWVPFCLVWTAAVLGAALKACNLLAHPWWSTALYVAMGWGVLAAALPLLGTLSGPAADLLVAGGIAYTAGTVFFVLDAQLRYAHAAWHCFVASGSGCHFFAVLGYAW